MAANRMVWDDTGERKYETGVSQVGLYVYDSAQNKYGSGVPWNGVTAITDSPSGAEATALYADNIKYLNLYSNEELGQTIEAYTYPPEFEACNGAATLTDGVVIGQQTRSTFGLVYKTQVGNDVDGSDYGYKIHIIYGAKASPSERAYNTINDSPDATTMSWEVTTTPVNVDGFKPTASVEIDSTKFTDAIGKKKLAAIEDKLYGSDNNEPTLLMPNEIAELVKTITV